jgi:hypothetical protein
MYLQIKVLEYQFFNKYIILAFFKNSADLLIIINNSTIKPKSNLKKGL